MNEKQIANVLVNRLKDMGFIIHRYNAKSTNSIYLKLDYGVCCGIRIADHNGKKKYHYRFNVIKDFKGDKIINFNNLVSYFFSYEEIPQILQKVQEERENKIKKYGLEKYRLCMQSEKVSNPLFKRFRKVS